MSLNNILNYSKIINYLLIIFAFIFPISIAGANFIIGLLILFWILEGNFKEKFNKLKQNKLIISLVLICITLIISSLFSNTLNNAFFMRHSIHNILIFYLEYFGFYILFFIIFYTSVKKDYLEKIISAFLFGMLFSEIVSYSIYFNLIDVHYFKAIGVIYKKAFPWDPSPFMHHSFYTLFLAVAILLIFDNLFRIKNKILIFFSIIFLLSGVTNLFLNGGRLGQVAFLISFLIYIFFKFKKIKIFLLGFFSLILITFLAFKFSPVFKHRTDMAINNIEQIIKHNNFGTSWGQRVGADFISFKILTDNYKNFIFGLGAGDAKKEYYNFAKTKYPKIYPQINNLIHVHNQFFQLWIDGGIVAFLLMILYFIFLYKFSPIPLTIGIIIVFIVGFFGDVLLYRPKTFLLLIFISVILINLSTCYETSNTEKDTF